MAGGPVGDRRTGNLARCSCSQVLLTKRLGVGRRALMGLGRVASVRRVKRSAGLGLVVVVLCVAACSSDAPGGPNRVHRLRDGFQLPTRTELIGEVVPDMASYIGAAPSGGPRRAWSAYFAISGDARRVYAALQGQAVRAGFSGMSGPDEACSTATGVGPSGETLRVPAPLTTCSGSGRQAGVVEGGPSFGVGLARCEGCQPESGIGLITYDAGPGTASTSQVRHLGVSQRIGPSNPRVWLRLPGTTVLRSGWLFACQQAQLVALSLTGNPAKVWQAALDNALTIDGAVSTGTDGVWQATTHDGSDVQSLTMDLGARPRPILFISLCEG